MKTITFYSYKGGVGRSLTLANIATRLAELNKSVCLVDFDLEAPGLPMKFENYINKPIQNGLVDYIYEYSNKGTLPPKIRDYSVQIELKGKKKINLIPAGNIDSDEYWKKLSSINWYDLVYENPDSISFFIDLKQKIKKEFNPDFLLIDSRTGISEMSGITISLLADDVVIVAANNRENLKGSKKIIEFLNNQEKSILGTIPKITFVLSRVPFGDFPTDVRKETILIEKIKSDIPLLDPKNIFVIHSDRELEEDETIKISHNIEEIADVNRSSQSVQIVKDYLAIFSRLVFDLFDEKDQERVLRMEQSNDFFRAAMRANGLNRILMLNTAIELNPLNYEALTQRAIAKVQNVNFEDGISDFKKLISLDPKRRTQVFGLLGTAYLIERKLDESLEYYKKILLDDTRDQSTSAIAYFGIGQVQSRQKEYENAVVSFTQAIANNYFNLSMALNSRANAYRLLGNYELALNDIYNALETDPNAAILYFTLAEICAAENKVKEFYVNLEIGLSRDAKLFRKIIQEEDIYNKFLDEVRFLNILEKYKIPLPILPKVNFDDKLIEKAKAINKRNDEIEYRKKFLDDPSNLKLGVKEASNLIQKVTEKINLLEQEGIRFSKVYNNNYPIFYILATNGLSFGFEFSAENDEGTNTHRLLSNANLSIYFCKGVLTRAGDTFSFKDGDQYDVYTYKYDLNEGREMGWKMKNEPKFFTSDEIANMCINWILDEMSHYISAK